MLHLRRNHRKEWFRYLPLEIVVAPGFSKESGEVFLFPDDPGMSGDDGMRTDDLDTDPDGHLSIVKLQNGISPGIPVGHRVAVAKIRYKRFA